jgi:hypothetical protein
MERRSKVITNGCRGEGRNEGMKSVCVCWSNNTNPPHAPHALSETQCCGRAQLNVCQLHLSFYAGSCAFEPSRTREMRTTCMATSVSLAVATA